MDFVEYYNQRQGVAMVDCNTIVTESGSGLKITKSKSNPDQRAIFNIKLSGVSHWCYSYQAEVIDEIPVIKFSTIPDDKAKKILNRIEGIIML
jgi:hypothetical protein